KIQTLKVMSRTSTAPYKKHTKNMREIGRELGVSHILEGSVRRAADKVHIVAQLIDRDTDQHVWSNTWDRDDAHLVAGAPDAALEDMRHPELAPDLAHVLRVLLVGSRRCARHHLQRLDL